MSDVEIQQDGGSVKDTKPHIARLELSEQHRLHNIRRLLVECTDNALEHVKGLTSSDDETKRTKGTQLLATLSPSAVKVYQLGEYEGRLEMLEQSVAALKGGKK